MAATFVPKRHVRTSGYTAAVSTPPRPLALATIAGLFIALVLPFVTYELSRAALEDTSALTRINLGFVVHWASFLLIIAILIFKPTGLFAQKERIG